MTFKTLAALSESIKGWTDTYTAQDTEDEYNRLPSVSWDEALNFVYERHGRYSVTNDRTGRTSFHEYMA